MPDTADDPEVALQKKNRVEALRQSLSRLSPDHREVIDLAYYHSKSVKEIAEVVGINEATVKTRMFYAREHWRASIRLARQKRWLNRLTAILSHATAELANLANFEVVEN